MGALDTGEDAEAKASAPGMSVSSQGRRVPGCTEGAGGHEDVDRLPQAKGTRR